MPTDLQLQENEVARAHLVNKRKAAELAKLALGKMETGLKGMAPPINPTGLSALAQATTQLFRMADGVTEHVKPRKTIARPLPTVNEALLHTGAQQVSDPAT